MSLHAARPAAAATTRKTRFTGSSLLQCRHVAVLARRGGARRLRVVVDDGARAARAGGGRAACRWPATISICRRWREAIERELPAYERSPAHARRHDRRRARRLRGAHARPLARLRQGRRSRAPVRRAAVHDEVAARRPRARALHRLSHADGARQPHASDATYRWPLYRRPKDAGGTADDGADPRRRPRRPRARAGAGWPMPTTRWRCTSRARAWSRCPTGALFPVGSDGHNGQTYQNVSKLLIADGRLPPGPRAAVARAGQSEGARLLRGASGRPRRLLGAQPALRLLPQRRQGGRRQVRRARRRPLGGRRRVARADGRAPVRARAEADRRRRRHHRLAADDAPGARRRTPAPASAGSAWTSISATTTYALAAAQAMTVQGDAWVLMPK